MFLHIISLEKYFTRYETREEAKGEVGPCSRPPDFDFQYAKLEDGLEIEDPP